MDSDDDYYGSDWEEEEEEEQPSDGEDHDYSAAVVVKRRKPYQILTEEDIKHLQENDISAVCGVLSVPRGVACALLCRNKWNLNAVYDHWFAAAADGERNPNPNHSAVEQGICKICYEYAPPEKMVSAACGHPFCSDCWKQYITTAIGDGAGCLTLRCPEPRCPEPATSDMVEKLSSAAEMEKYHQYLLRSYVESSRNKKWCPAAGCDRAVEFDAAGDGDGESYDVACDCSHKFCWRCAEDRHRPLSCDTVAKWAEKNRSEAANTTWIIAYSKPCPKCRRPIEKNQGCNHMTCGTPCGYHFCWMCLEPWDKHSYSNPCNRYSERRERESRNKNEKVDENEMSRRKARRLLQRYTHYYERWDTNGKSGKRAMADLEKAREKYEGQVGLQFLIGAWEQIVECRRVLKLSYVYGYYLQAEEAEEDPKAEGGKKKLFEYLQGVAEAELERLHHCVEKEIVGDDLFYVDSEESRVFRAKLLNLTKVASNYFENLVVGLANNLDEAY